MEHEQDRDGQSRKLACHNKHASCKLQIRRGERTERTCHRHPPNAATTTSSGGLLPPATLLSLFFGVSHVERLCATARLRTFTPNTIATAATSCSLLSQPCQRGVGGVDGVLTFRIQDTTFVVDRAFLRSLPMRLEAVSSCSAPVAWQGVSCKGSNGSPAFESGVSSDVCETLDGTTVSMSSILFNFAISLSSTPNKLSRCVS